MTISAIGQGVQSFAGVQKPDFAAMQKQMQQQMTPVAKLFGETPQQLMQELRSGSTSLGALAQSKGISQNDLLAAIKQGLQQARGQASSLSDAQLDSLASMIANRTPGAHDKHTTSGVTDVRPASRDDGQPPADKVASGTASQQVDLAQILFQLQLSAGATATAPSWTDGTAVSPAASTLTQAA